MSKITIDDTEIELHEGESVLEGLARSGIPVPSSCRNGICQTCLLRATKGVPPPLSQNGLKPTLSAQNYFLSCVCRPTENLTVTRAEESISAKIEAKVIEKTALNEEIFRFRLLPNSSFDYRAGQFLHLHRPDGLIRSYSLASVPSLGEPLEIHVRLLKGGAMTTWLIDSVQVGESLVVSGPAGNCFYLEGREQQNLLLIGTGSGLAPLYGIVRNALATGHSGKVTLYHGSWIPEGLYLVEELRALTEEFPQFSYVPCADNCSLPGYTEGQAHRVALEQNPDLKDWRVFLCGHPNMVATAKRKAYLAGASLSDIYADPFVLSQPPS